MNNTVPFVVQVVSPSTFSLVGPTLNYNGIYQLVYNGVLNRTLATNLTVTFYASDNKGFSAITTIPIIVGDVLTSSPISDGFKTISVLYVNGYMNSLKNVPLGSIYVQDTDDWFQASRVYSVRDASNGQTFNTIEGQLSTSDVLYPGSYTIRVDVTKPIAASSALSTIDFAVTSIDSEYVRNAATIRIQGNVRINDLMKINCDCERPIFRELFIECFAYLWRNCFLQWELISHKSLFEPKLGYVFYYCDEFYIDIS